MEWGLGCIGKGLVQSLVVETNSHHHHNNTPQVVPHPHPQTHHYHDNTRWWGLGWGLGGGCRRSRNSGCGVGKGVVVMWGVVVGGSGGKGEDGVGEGFEHWDNFGRGVCVDRVGVVDHFGKGLDIVRPFHCDFDFDWGKFDFD